MSGSPAVARSQIVTDPPKGTRDFPPEDMRMRTWLFSNFRDASFIFESLFFWHELWLGRLWLVPAVSILL